MTNQLGKSILIVTYLTVISTVICTLYSCKNTQEPVTEITEDIVAKKKLQGIWTNEYEGNIVFSIHGDSIYYNDSLSTPAKYRVNNDTLYIYNQNTEKYPIHKLNSSTLVFINANGDEVTLTKSNETQMLKGERKGTVTLNQGKKLKKDTILTFHDKHYHAYTQVNPTTYKVFIQSRNNDGMNVESIYFDNIVHIALYEGNRRIFGQNISKSDFSKYVPKSYLDQAVLSDIYAEKATDNGVRFVAIITIPNSYTNYHVNIDISSNGQKTFSL